MREGTAKSRTSENWAVAISASASWTFESAISMFDWPEQIQTSPTRTLESATVAFCDSTVSVRGSWETING